MHESHFQPTTQQLQHQNAASSNRALFAAENHGVPAIAATPRPGAFNDRAAMPVRTALAERPGGGEVNTGTMHPESPAHQPQEGESHPGTPQPDRGQDRAARAPQQQARQPHPPQQHNQQAHRSAPAPHPHPRPQQRPQQGK